MVVAQTVARPAKPSEENIALTDAAEAFDDTPRLAGKLPGALWRAMVIDTNRYSNFAVLMLQLRCVLFYCMLLFAALAIIILVPFYWCAHSLSPIASLPIMLLCP